MFSDMDWTDRHEVENARRSIAMQTPGTLVLDKPAAIAVLEALRDALEAADQPSGLD